MCYNAAMQTEHLQSVKFRLVALAWFIAVAISSLIMVALLAFNLIQPDTASSTRAALAAVAVGFFAGGMYAGLRAQTAPILHGVSIGLLSLLAWFALNVITTVAFPRFGWSALTPNLAVATMLVMIISAVLGARGGHRKIK